LTARTVGRCVPLLDRGGVPEHIRAWTSGPVLAVEADLTARLAARATDRPAGVPDTDVTPPVHITVGATRLDPGQAAAVAAAVGRGGVLDLAAAQVDPTGHLRLVGVHRFTRTDATGRTTPDTDYAELTLAMRAGTNPGTVFEALLARGQIRLHPDAQALREAL